MNRKTVLITGGQGFVGSYICQELLNHDYNVISIDNFSKYGCISRLHDNHPNFSLIKGDVVELGAHRSTLRMMVEWDYDEFDCIIACASKVGGIRYFHDYPCSLLLDNNDILSATFRYAIDLYERKKLSKIVYLSSSMVFESTNRYPSKESDLYHIPPPLSTYGHSKFGGEYYCRGTYKEFGLPYIILRPFNICGIGEEDKITAHVLPDLVRKCLDGQDPLHILGKGNQIRCLTHGSDMARGLRMAIESDRAINEDFNISNNESMTVLELAERIWRKINPDKNFSYVCDTPYEFDVQKRIPDTTKAKELLGFEAKVSVDESIDEVIEWTKKQYNL